MVNPSPAAKPARFIRTAVGAHYGLRDWLLQRITAILMLVYVLVLAAFLLAIARISPDLSGWSRWRALFSLTWVRVFGTITLLALVIHAWVGMRDLWMDYVQDLLRRLLLHVFTAVWLLASLIYALAVLWGGS